MPPLATSTFLQALFAAMIIIPCLILWVAAVVDVIRQGGSGLKIAAMLVLILILPIIGPLLYFIFRKPPPVDVDAAAMAEAELRRQAHDRPIGGTGVYR